MRAGPAPPSARPAQWRRAARASPPPWSVTAGGSRNLATPRPRLRRGRRADARQPQNGGGGASGGQSRACPTPSSHALPRLHRSGVSIPARRNPGPPHPNPSPLLPGFGQGGSQEAGRGTQPRRKNDQNQDRPSTFTSPQTRPQGRRAPAPTSSKLRSLDAVLRKESSPGH